MKRFKRVYIEITNQCNLACPFCKQSMRDRGFMPRYLFEKIISQAKDVCEEAAFHILGEPLLHPDIFHFIDYTRGAGMNVMITTNGTLLARNSDALIAADIRQMNISLHAVTALPERERLLQEIFTFTSLVRENRPERFVNLRIWNTLSADNGWVVDSINSFFGTSIELPVSAEEFKDFKSRPLGGRVYLHFDTAFEWPDIHGPVLQERGFCYGTKSHFGILSDGRVVPCCLDADGGIALGSAADEDLCAILDSVRAKKIFNGFGRGVLVEDLCRRCGYISRFEKEQAVR